MFVRNKDIRELKGDIPFWVIAERLGVSENTVFNWMKKDFTEERKKRFVNVIEQIKAEMSRKAVK